MDFENMVKSEDYLINLGRFIEKLDNVIKYHRSWQDLSNTEKQFNTDDGTMVIIELVPTWADLESLECRDALDLYNEYYDTNYKDDARVNWYDMDIKIRILNYQTGLDNTYEIYYFDNGELKSL